jgi:hypothetical protein
MKPWGKVSSIPGASTLFEGQQINGQIGETQKREHTERRQRREDTHREERHKRETEERSKTEIKEDPSSRSKETPGPLRDTASEGPSTL